MSSLIGVLQLGAMTFVLFALAAMVVVTALLPVVLRRAHARPPAVAATRLRWVLASPIAAGTVLTVAAFSPSVFASLLGHHHHCSTHEGHPHLCLVHLPAGAGSMETWLLLGVAVAFVALRLRPLLAEVRRARRLVADLELEAAHRDGGARIVESGEPLCAAIGWLSPSLVVSRGFLRDVDAAHAEAALAHERAHARRRDAWWTFVARLCAVGLPAFVGRRVLRELDLATERACDEEAGIALGDRLAVASAIVASERLALRSLGVVAASFDGAAAEARVRALLEEPSPRPTTWRRWDVRAAALVVLAFASANPLHHAAETLIGLTHH